MRTALSATFFSVLLAACDVAPAEVDQKVQQPDVRQSLESVRGLLPHPDSADFRDVYLGLSEVDGRVVCGEIDVTDQFEGYEGFVRFLAFPDQGSAVLDPDRTPARVQEIVETRACRQGGGSRLDCHNASKRTRWLTFFHPIHARLCARNVSTSRSL